VPPPLDETNKWGSANWIYSPCLAPYPPLPLTPCLSYTFAAIRLINPRHAVSAARNTVYTAPTAPPTAARGRRYGQIVDNGNKGRHQSSGPASTYARVGGGGREEGREERNHTHSPIILFILLMKIYLARAAGAAHARTPSSKLPVDLVHPSSNLVYLSVTDS
jgi:hypothetical protein